MFGYAANYYLPAQHDVDETQRSDETPPPAKKQRQSVFSTPPRAARILGRKYALTATSYKYIEIGISVGSVSTVEIVLSDNRGTQLLLPIATWKTLIEKRDDILRLLEESSRSSLWIRDLAVRVCTISNSKIFKLTLSDSCMYLKPSTMHYLFTLEHCIDLVYVWLMENTHLVNIKFRNFVNVLREKNITEICNAAKAIRESEVFDSESLIDCELLACALNTIVCNV